MLFSTQWAAHQPFTHDGEPSFLLHTLQKLKNGVSYYRNSIAEKVEE